MITKTPLKELESRMKNFRSFMDEQCPGWEFAVLFSKINLYYFTGTMQDGMLIIEKNGSTFWIRKSFERAKIESLFEDLKPMNSYRDAAAVYADLPETVYIETEVVPLAMYSRFQKHFPFKNFESLDHVVARLRSIKSHYELSLMKRAGEIHRHVLEDLVPEILVAGMSETEFASNLFKLMMDEGHHGVSRFGMFDTEMVLGQLGFGESSIHPSYFNGPGGNSGISPAVPLIGSRDRKLQGGDLVFVDVGCGVEGYNTDKTMTYMYQAPLKKEAIEAHEICVEIQNNIASMLKPGAVPSEIYRTVIDDLDPEFLENFMGYENRTVKFLGHGIGLLIDETPVIAKGFNEPIEEGMVFAVEPKKGIKGVGMVGIENTFIVTKNGGECITGKNPGLIPVDFE